MSGTPSHAPALPMMIGWFWNGIDRNCAKTQPRLNPAPADVAWPAHCVNARRLSQVIDTDKSYRYGTFQCMVETFILA